MESIARSASRRRPRAGRTGHSPSFHDGTAAIRAAASSERVLERYGRPPKARDVETFTVRGSGPAAYERYLVPVLFRPLAERLLARAGVRPGERLLDVACGTGIVARTAAAAGVRPTGTDLNPEMLAIARGLA